MTVPDKLQDKPIFIPIPRGRGKSAHIDYTDPAHHVPFSDIDLDQENYGVSAGPLPDASDITLVLVDIDEMDEFQRVDTSGLADTITVETPHGGEHRYYLAPTKEVERFKDRFDPKYSKETTYGEIKYETSYVVGPDSWYHRENCDKCDGGRHEYTADDHHIKTINQRALNHLYIPPNNEANNRSSNPAAEESAENTSNRSRKPTGLPNDTARFVTNTAKTWTNGDKLTHLHDGNWRRLGYPSQSEADQAYCQIIAFATRKLLGEFDPDVIDAAMRRSDLNRPKWDRDDYRKWTIDNAIAYAKENYNPQPVTPETNHGERLLDEIIADADGKHDDATATFAQIRHRVRRVAQANNMRKPTDTALGRALTRKGIERRYRRSTHPAQGRTTEIRGLLWENPHRTYLRIRAKHRPPWVQTVPVDFDSFNPWVHTPEPCVSRNHLPGLTRDTTSLGDRQEDRGKPPPADRTRKGRDGG